MSSTVEKISGNQVRIHFDIPAEQYDAAIQKAYLKLRGRIRVPGFRPGKAPRKVIENMYGEDVFYEDAFNEIAAEQYDAAIDEHELFPVDQPQVDNVDQMKAGKDLKFSITVFVKPEVTLGQYEGLKATRFIHKVTDEEIDRRIQADVDKASTLEDVEGRPVQEGDTITLNYSGSVDGVKFEGGTAENQTLEIGSHSFIKGFEEQLVGMNAGDEATIRVTFPEEYHAPDLAGKDAEFEVKVLGIQQTVKPELDDDFAADVSDFSTFEEYKASIVKELEDQAANNTKIRLENDLIQQATDAADCDIPEAMITRELERLKEQLKYNMMYQGLSFEDYLKYTGQTEADLDEQNRPRALNDIKTQLVMEAIVDKEQPEVTDEDVDKQVEERAKRYNRSVESYRENLAEREMESIREEVKMRKVIDKMIDTAVIEDKEDKDQVDLNQVADDMMQVVDDLEEEKEDKE